MEQLDKFIEVPFDGNVHDLPIPKDVIEPANKHIDDIKNDNSDMTGYIVEKNEVDAQMKKGTSTFLIQELEDTYLDLNKTISLLQNRKLGFHSDMDFMVRRICQDHQVEKS